MPASAKPKGASLIRTLFVALPIALGAAPASAQERPLEVRIHQATRVNLSAAAGSVIVANPGIADVAVTDARTLFITGKDYGVTEIIAVDALGRPLRSYRAATTARTGRMARRRSESWSMPSA